MPECDEGFVLAADKLAGGAVTIPLRSAVKSRLLHQPVHDIIRKRGGGPVLVCQGGDAPGAVVFHASGQAALSGTEHISPFVVPRFAAAAIRMNDGRQVTRNAVFITCFMALRILPADEASPTVVYEIPAESFFLMNGRYLTEAVVFIPGFTARAVGEGEYLTVTVPDHTLFTAGGVLHGAGQLILRAGIKPAGGAALAGGLFRQPSLLIVYPAGAKAVRPDRVRQLTQVTVIKPRAPAVRSNSLCDLSGPDVQPVLRPASGRIRLRQQAAGVVEFAEDTAAVRLRLLHHPLQPAFAFGVQHLPAVQAVGEGDGVPVVTVGVAQPSGIVLRHYPPGVIVAIGGLRTSGVLVCRHASGVFIIICKTAHLSAAPVIHRRQLAAWGVCIAHQRLRGQVIRVCRVVHQPHRVQTDTAVGAVAGGRRGLRPVLLPDAGCGSLLTCCLCPLRQCAQRQPEAPACAVGDGGDVPGERPLRGPVKGEPAPETVRQPGQDPVWRQRRGQDFLHVRDAFRPAEYPPRPLRAVRRQVKVLT